MPNNVKYADRISEFSQKLTAADFLIIGAGSGLSAAAGLDYADEKFRHEFGNFILKYGFEDLYTSSFYKFETEEERWAYWAKHIDFARFAPPPSEVYKQLLQLVENKNYFVITTNTDGQFEKAGFPREKIFAVQGDYAYLQCACACHDKLYYDKEITAEMLENLEEDKCTIPSRLVPKCPVCGGKMDVNLRKDEFFVEDENWHLQAKSYSSFLRRAVKKNLLLLEIGVGFNTPGIIRFPFEEIANEYENTALVRINRDYSVEFSFQKPGGFFAFEEDISLIINDLNCNA